jgi:hypothetical protein
MAIQLKSTRVRPNTEIQWSSISPNEDPAVIYYISKYIDSNKAAEISFSETDLQRVIVREFSSVEDKNAYIAEFANTSSPLYARTQYNTTNGITLTHETI